MVSPDVVPRWLMRRHSINDNYCKSSPVPVARPVSSVKSVVARNSFVSVPTNVSYHVVCRVPTVTRRQSQKKDVRPKSKIKSQIKCVKSASFVGHFVSAPNVPNVPTVASVQPVGGRLQSFWEIWAHKGANPKVVSILKEGYVFPFKVRPPLVRVPLIVSGYANPIRDSHLQAAVQALIEKKAVERVRVQTSLAFFNRLFIVPKPNHKWRPILDLSTLNQFLCVKTFKMETPETIRTSLQQEEWVTSLDFSDAYFHIPIHFTSRKFLRFHFQNQSYQFRALPFGLSTAPMEFTGVVKEVKLMAQSQGIRIHQYLDDWLIRAPTKESCHQGTQSLLALCQELGWMVNMQKSELEPQQVFDFVGYQYDLLNGVVRPTQNRWEALQQKITVLLQNRSCRVRTFMSLIGLLTATEKQVTLGRLHMRPIQWHLKKHWRVPESLEKEIPIPRSLHQYLQWWTQEENVLKGQPLHPLRHAVQIFTDASKEGWGAHLGDFTASGTWSVPESKLHINFLELKAVLLALKRFQHLVQGKVVLIATDNTTVVAYINKEGGMRSGSLCALLWRLLCWCSLNQIVLKARHIPGRLNVIADKLSRQRQVIQTEWSLHQETFDLLCQTWHYPRVDMFATRYNCKLVQFVSPIPDPKDELLYLSSFNQNVSFAMGKSLQHLADFTFVQMVNLTLLRRDSYLEAVKPGIKPDTFNSLRNCPLNGYGLFPDAAIRKAEDEINQLEASRRTSQPGPGRGGFAGRGRKQRYQPYSTGWKPQDTAKTTSQAGKELPAWKAFGSRNRGRGRGRGGQPGRGTKMAHEKTQYK